tara:strand:- start:75 stop:251 length:177 start_codon:yes stop_codon:yes gene_type:complete
MERGAIKLPSLFYHTPASSIFSIKDILMLMIVNLINIDVSSSNIDKLKGNNHILNDLS